MPWSRRSGPLVAAIREGNVLASISSTLWANPVAAFVSVDLSVAAIAGLIFIASEGRRLRIRWWPFYFALTFLVAISVSLPLFLAVRRAALAPSDHR